MLSGTIAPALFQVQPEASRLNEPPLTIGWLGSGIRLTDLLVVPRYTKVPGEGPSTLDADELVEVAVELGLARGRAAALVGPVAGGSEAVAVSV